MIKTAPLSTGFVKEHYGPYAGQVQRTLLVGDTICMEFIEENAPSKW